MENNSRLSSPRAEAVLVEISAAEAEIVAGLMTVTVIEVHVEISEEEEDQVHALIATKRVISQGNALNV